MESIGHFRGEEEFACLAQFSGLQKIKTIDTDFSAKHRESNTILWREMAVMLRKWVPGVGILIRTRLGEGRGRWSTEREI